MNATELREQPRIIAVEEHFWTPKIRDLYTRRHTLKSPERARKLADLGATRLREMDEAGIDLQVMSLVQPGVQVFDAESAVALARETNDVLHQTIQSYPDRFAGFAAIPTPDPKAAADELERTVLRYGFKGAMVCGLTNGDFLDGEAYWPIFERAQEIDVPVYLHPAVPHASVIDAYYQDYSVLFGAAWGFAIETATHAVRLILSGLFDRFPELRIILGHFGEALPFLCWRGDAVIGRGDNLSRSFKEYFQRHFLYHDQLRFLLCGDDVLCARTRNRQNHVRRRLAVSIERRRRKLRQQRADQRTGQAEDLLLQCGANSPHMKWAVRRRAAAQGRKTGGDNRCQRLPSCWMAQFPSC